MVCDERKYVIAGGEAETGFGEKDGAKEGFDGRDVAGVEEVDGAAAVGANRIGLDTVSGMC